MCGVFYMERGRDYFVWDRDLICVSGGCMDDIYIYYTDLVSLITQQGKRT